ncbi:MAG: primosomal protein N' [Rhodocyclaceae bacterium]|nr:primosomal protein N' [Rhodocyclaceae bacterium]
MSPPSSTPSTASAGNTTPSRSPPDGPRSAAPQQGGVRPGPAGSDLGPQDSGPHDSGPSAPARAIRVALDVPLAGPFDYLPPPEDLLTRDDVGRRVVVPFGRRRVAGVVLAVNVASDWPVAQLKPIEQVDRRAPPVPAEVLGLATFAADYYRANLGEVLLPALPPALRGIKQWRMPKSVNKRGDTGNATDPGAPRSGSSDKYPSNGAGRGATEGGSGASSLTSVDCHPRPGSGPDLPTLTAEQSAALGALAPRLGAGFSTTLLHGVTGSGKTEVYLRLLAEVLVAGGQALVLVPEINLVPQMLARVRERFPHVIAVPQHSALADGERLAAWLAAQQGDARVVVGTRLAVFAPLPHLALVIVDEEHDASYKQQDGPRIHARDLALYRAQQREVPVVLGSATPSLETWARAEAGAIERVSLRQRARAAALPRLELVDLRRGVVAPGISARLLDALRARLARGEQSLVFINRRGYSPTLRCNCGWLADCRRCSAHLVLHRQPRSLRCHHCGAEHVIPKACPDCGNLDLQPVGQATQRIETLLADLLPGARIARVDRDAVRRREDWPQLLADIEARRIDVLVGTQMLSKGHDFPGITLVGVVDADGALYASDFRAPERLFAQLLQVAGRAGRGESPGEVLVQTRLPEHPLFESLLQADYQGFAAEQLAERRAAGLPPFAHLAMVRAEAASDEPCERFLDAVAHTARDFATAGRQKAQRGALQVFDAVPAGMQRVAGQHRWQLMIQSTQRPALRALLAALAPRLPELAARAVRWAIDVDPQLID